MKKTNKKGQMSAMPFTIITLIVTIIIFVLGLVIIQETRDVNMISASDSQSYSNETVSNVLNSTDTNLACASAALATCSITTLTNATNGIVINSTEHLQTNCVVRSVGSNAFNGSDWNATYSCTYGGEAFDGVNESLVGFGDFADFIPIIVIAIAAGLVMAIILSSFVFKGRKR